MRVGLFIPCYMDAFEPEVGVATLELLERLGCTVEHPYDQTCCGQPMTNTGCHREAIGAEELFVRNFAGYDYIVNSRPPDTRFFILGLPLRATSRVC